MKLYDRAMKCLKDITENINELKAILESTPTDVNKLTKEEQDRLQVEMVRFMLTVREFNKHHGG